MIDVVAIAGTGLAGLIGLALLAMKLAAAMDRERDSAVDAATKAGTIAIRDATIATLTAALATEKERADAIDAELFKNTDPGDAAGARDRLLQAWRDRTAAGATAGTGPLPVPATPATRPA